MHTINKITLFLSLAILPSIIFTINKPTTKKNQQNNQSPIGSNPYTWSPQIFETKQDIMGKYWQGNGTKEYPAKAFIDDIEYVDIITIPHDKKPKRHKNNQSPIGSNPYTWSPQIFETKQGIMGKYWQGNGTKEYPAKAFIDDIEYVDIITIPHDKKPKRHKKMSFLGSLVEMKANDNGIVAPIVSDLYGKPKNKFERYNGPDAGVYAFQRERNAPFESDAEGN